MNVCFGVQAHEDRNLANKLTPAERREKKVRKLTGAASEGEALSVSVYRVNSATTPQQNFKIRANAEACTLNSASQKPLNARLAWDSGSYKPAPQFKSLYQKQIPEVAIICNALPPFQYADICTGGLLASPAHPDRLQ